VKLSSTRCTSSLANYRVCTSWTLGLSTARPRSCVTLPNFLVWTDVPESEHIVELEPRTWGLWAGKSAVWWLPEEWHFVRKIYMCVSTMEKYPKNLIALLLVLKCGCLQSRRWKKSRWLWWQFLKLITDLFVQRLNNHFPQQGTLLCRMFLS
jgi:hypothetical protein